NVRRDGAACSLPAGGGNSLGGGFLLRNHPAVDPDLFPRRMSRHLMPASITPSNAWGAWSWEPIVLVLLVLAAALYAMGVRRLWRASSPGAGVRKWEAA